VRRITHPAQCRNERREICHGKTYASLTLGRASRLVLEKAKEKPLFMQSAGELAGHPMFLEGGDQLIRDAAGEVMGAIGVTGDVNEMDDICAIAGIHAVGLISTIGKRCAASASSKNRRPRTRGRSDRRRQLLRRLHWRLSRQLVE
jgi:Haem-degrading